MGFLEKLREKDNFWIGLVLGIALPAILYPILRPLDPKNFAFIANSYRQSMLKLLPMLLSRCIFPNAILFFLFIWGKFDLTAKGILHSSIGLVVILILIEFIF
jgi:hypothetical protein